MHLLVRETRSLDEQEQADDLGHAPADVVVLSFSDSDLAGLAASWGAMPDSVRPSLRLASLARLRHPMSVDLYAENTVASSGCVLVRLLGRAGLLALRRGGAGRHLPPPWGAAGTGAGRRAG